MDEGGNEYQRRRGKRGGYRHGARNRRYYEQTDGDGVETGAHSSSM